MIIVIAIACGLLALAAVSAVAAYRWSGSAAWDRAYNSRGVGLVVELVTLGLLFLMVVTVSVIMGESSRSIFLEGGWRSPWIGGTAAVMAFGVLVYMLVVAPAILTRKQQVAKADIGRECRRPYLLYTPYSLIFWVTLILPMVACIGVTLLSDHAVLAAEKTGLHQLTGSLLAMAAGDAAPAGDALPLYSLEHAEAVEVIQHMVDRYLWTVGIFIVFLITMLNTRITAVFTRQANDAFKWVMWLLLAVGIGVSLFGLHQYQLLRGMAIELHVGLEAAATAQGQTDILLSAKERLLELRLAGSIQFLRRILEGGSIWLLFFSYGSQIVVARMTHRSVVDIIFPTPVARFLGRFVLSGDDETT